MSRRQLIKYSCILAGILVTAGLLLGGDFSAFLRWYLIILLLGFGLYPLTAVLFDTFSDHGWIFSKVIATAVGGYVAWLFVASGLQQFTSRRCIVVTLIIFGICWVWYLSKPRKSLPRPNLVLFEEILFLAVMLVWTYFFTFRPEAMGTEKFMDYGFMVSMERSTALPAKDMWYGLAPVNYYYGGQYLAVYLSKFSYLPVRLTYNLMRAAEASFAFCLPFSMVYHMVKSRLKEHAHKHAWSIAGGIFGGTAVSLAGNVHYILYGLFGKVFQLSGYESYWFPSSTRYIGHNPETADQCIHEFPSYSFVLGDLHAHMLNIMIVLTILGLLYAWVRQVRFLELDRLEKERIEEEKQRKRPSKFIAKNAVRIFLRINGLEMRFLAAGILIGLCKWTNYWDYVIYFTVAMFVVLAVSLYRYQDSLVRVLWSLLLHAAELWLLTFLVPLPFMLSFEATVSGVGIAEYHSYAYQLLILWGLPVASALLLLIASLRKYRAAFADLSIKERRPGKFWCFFRFAPQADRFALVLFLCAFGLILLPELVYVRDIYENGYSRANTMFKLTYQAYIMFGIAMAYALIRLLVLEKNIIFKALSIVLVCIFSLTVGYLPYSVKQWFGNVLDPSMQEGLDATAFIYREYPNDAGAIDWLRTYVKEQPLILEAPGDSYSRYCRVSAVTGLPTLEGWYVHEWLWRGNVDDLNKKAEDIRKIYEADNVQEAEDLLDAYDVEYLFVGSCEHEKYEIHDAILQSLGEIMYEEKGTYIVRLGEQNGSV
ncbi:MAG: hypothetical protein IKE31_02050 [Eubacterium sp.]|nr:hypothetical protein [Eubacterium sp.]